MEKNLERIKFKGVEDRIGYKKIENNLIKRK